MSAIHVIARGTEDDREFFDGEGGWCPRIDADEYPTQEAAAEDILKYRLGLGDICAERVSMDYFVPRF